MQLVGAVVAIALGSSALAQSTAVRGTFDANKISYTAQSRKPSVLHLYDNFNQAFLDPSKWIGNWQCGPAMECVREIENGQLRFRVRSYGSSNSNSGTGFSNSSVDLTADFVNTIKASVTVRNSNPTDCPTNIGVAHSQVAVSGSFFNGGGGTAADDVTAFLQLDRYAASEPGTVEVAGFLLYQGQFFDNVDLGPVNIGETVIVALQWDKANHRFAVELNRPKYKTKAVEYMPYTISDTTPPVGPRRTLGANVYPSNCMESGVPADLDVSFDNVYTN